MIQLDIYKKQEREQSQFLFFYVWIQWETDCKSFRNKL